MNLKDRLININTVEANWAIYADIPFSEDSETRIGQTQFENGGLLDKKEIVGTFENLHDRIENQIDSDLGDEDYQREVAIECLIPELEDERHRLA